MNTSRRILAAALLCLIGTLPALAVDTLSEKEAPDLTAVRALIKSKDYTTARDQLFVIANTIQHADVYNLLGFSLRKTGDYRQALTFYQKALDFDPDHKGALEYLGELYVETGQPEKAKAQRAKLASLCPSGCEELEDLDQALRAAGITP